MNNLQKKYVINKKLISAELDKEICLFDEEKGEYINLNETASFIWNFLEESKDINQLLIHCRKNFEVNDIDLSKEIEKFIQKAVKNCLLIEFNT